MICHSNKNIKKYPASMKDVDLSSVSYSLSIDGSESSTRLFYIEGDNYDNMLYEAINYINMLIIEKSDFFCVIVQKWKKNGQEHSRIITSVDYSSLYNKESWHTDLSQACFFYNRKPN